MDFISFNRALKKHLVLDAFLVATEQKIKIRKFWLERLRALELVDFKNILDRIGEEIMSDIAKEFALQMLRENIDRLLRVDNG